MQIEEIGFAKRKKAEALVLPFVEGKKGAQLVSDLKSKEFLKLPSLKNKDFSGKQGEVSLVYSEGLEKRILLLGLGKENKISDETLRLAYAALVKKCRALKLKTVNLLFPKKLKSKTACKAIVEGLFLTNYAFSHMKKESLKKVLPLIEKAFIIDAPKGAQKLINKIEIIADGIYLVRDLVMNHADEITPRKLAQVAKSFEKISKKVKVEVFDRKRIEKEKMGLLLAVSRSSFREPTFTVIHYNGNPKGKKIALIGKGLTYDTGGLSLKPSTSMDTMKCDMAGGASVLGTMYTAALLNLKVNLVGVIPATENAIGSESYKPGDVYTSYCGKTVEVENTDAEGRLILADALGYTVKKLKPAYMINLATLTGAITIALGEEIAGLFSNSEKLVNKLKKASHVTGEKLWNMPLYDEYLKSLESDIADLKNVGGRQGGSITAALFLQEFVRGCPWAHLDIGGTAYYSKAKGYDPVLATGYGVRLLIEFLENGI